LKCGGSTASDVIRSLFPDCIQYMWLTQHYNFIVCLHTSMYLLVGVGDTALMKLLLRQNAELRQQVMLNTRFLQELLKNQKVSDRLAAGKLPDNVQLPLKSQDDLYKLERQIVSQEIFIR